MIEINLHILLAKKRWKQIDLVRKTGIRANTISDLCNGRSTGISTVYMDLICGALECDVSDIFKYVQDNKNAKKFN